MITLHPTYLFRFLPVALLALWVLQPVVAFAQATTSLSNDQLNVVSKQCSGTQISLEQLQKRDAVSRINRGRAYDQLMTQTSAFNSRLTFNKVSVPDLVPLTGELQSHIDQFRAVSDKQYLEHLINATKFDCKAKPAEFYALILQVRDDRDKVVAEISKIDELMAKYREALVKYQGTLPVEQEGNNAR